MRIITLVSFIIVSLSLFAQAVGRGVEVRSHDLEMSFNLKEHSFEAVDKMILAPGGDRLIFLLNKQFEVSKIKLNDKKTKFKILTEYDWRLFEDDFSGDDSLFFSRAAMVQIKLKKKQVSLDSLRLSVHYSGVLYDTVEAAAFSRMQIADQTIGLIGEEGIYLSPESNYYPYFNDNLTYFSLTAYTPRDYKTVTDGGLEFVSLRKDKQLFRWAAAAPTDGLYISAARWNMIQDKTGDTEIYGFFFPEDSALSYEYVRAAKRYIELYENLLGAYPYPKFAVVENFFPTGYGMPSWTLLGRAVVRLPWIVNISLGHEVCHNWWGNGVFVDYEKGNWCEGLTTYCADYLYKEQKTPEDAVRYRRDINQDYTIYVRESNDFPLSEFTSRTETHTRAIGYGKSAMVFHMLRDLVGEDDFWGALRKFYKDNLWKRASWNDIRAAFENQCKDDLGWFFQQWVENTGAPKIEDPDFQLDESTNQCIVKIRFRQNDERFTLKLPITIYSPGGEDTRWYEITPGEHRISIACDERPAGAAIDPGFNVFRVLDRDEYPATLSEVVGAENQVIVLPSNAEEEKREAYRNMADDLSRNGKAKVALDTAVKYEKLAESSFFILGSPYENSLYSMMEKAGMEWGEWITYIGGRGGFILRGEDFSDDGVASMVAVRNPANRIQSVVAFQATSPREIERVGRKLLHYGKYSYLAFAGGKNKLKGNWSVVDSPLMKKFD